MSTALRLMALLIAIMVRPLTALSCEPSMSIEVDPSSCADPGSSMSYMVVKNQCECNVRVTAYFKGGGAHSLNVAKRSSERAMVKGCSKVPIEIKAGQAEMPNCREKQPERSGAKPDQEGSGQPPRDPLDDALREAQDKAANADERDRANRKKVDDEMKAHYGGVERRQREADKERSQQQTDAAGDTQSSQNGVLNCADLILEAYHSRIEPPGLLRDDILNLVEMVRGSRSLGEAMPDYFCNSVWWGFMLPDPERPKRVNCSCP